jgi:hypothetical protein
MRSPLWLVLLVEYTEIVNMFSIWSREWTEEASSWRRGVGVAGSWILEEGVQAAGLLGVWKSPDPDREAVGGTEPRNWAFSSSHTSTHEENAKPEAAQPSSDFVLEKKVGGWFCPIPRGFEKTMLF